MKKLQKHSPCATIHAYKSMEALPTSIIAVIAILTIFLSLLTALKYAVQDDFTRMRFIMTAFFCFIVATLTVSYWQFFFATLPFTIPAGLVGIVAGYFVGVRAAEQRLRAEGVAHYLTHFAHIHLEKDAVNWWSLINFYSVMGALLLINLVGLTTVIFHNLKPMTLATSAVGAFLIGSIVPYVIHLWTINVRQKRSRKTSDQ